MFRSLAAAQIFRKRLDIGIVPEACDVPAFLEKDFETDAGAWPAAHVHKQMVALRGRAKGLALPESIPKCFRFRVG